MTMTIEGPRFTTEPREAIHPSGRPFAGYGIASLEAAVTRAEAEHFCRLANNAADMAAALENLIEATRAAFNTGGAEELDHAHAEAMRAARILRAIKQKERQA